MSIPVSQTPTLDDQAQILGDTLGVSPLAARKALLDLLKRLNQDTLRALRIEAVLDGREIDIAHKTLAPAQ